MENKQIKNYKGYRYVSVLLPTDLIGGYVEIPANHTLWEYYCDRLSNAFRTDENDTYIETLFDDRGTLDFSHLVEPNQDNPIFERAVGFESEHIDENDIEEMFEFCEEECQRFIDQLVEFDKRFK